MGASRRAAIIDVARAAGVTILEDDAYGLLPAKPLPALAALWPEGVFHVATTAKALSPGLRLAYVVSPPGRAEGLAEALHAIAQMPAVLAYLGTTLDLMPQAPEPAALTHKIIADANDVLDEVTRFGGRSMWSRDEWDSFTEDRLPRWAQIFEATGHAHGLKADSGHMLGTDAPGLADLVTATLWFTMTAQLPELRPLVEAHAPHVLSLGKRIMSTDDLAAMRDDTDTRFGHAWCGGQIEASIREMLNAE